VTAAQVLMPARVDTATRVPVSSRNSVTVRLALKDRRACRVNAGLGLVFPWPSPSSFRSCERLHGCCKVLQDALGRRASLDAVRHRLPIQVKGAQSSCTGRRGWHSIEALTPQYILRVTPKYLPLVGRWAILLAASEKIAFALYAHRRQRSAQPSRRVPRQVRVLREPPRARRR
jgi:hypothetical protein